ncbi:hypothetical protein DB30_06189 [Enhygromyxa salina]|uniref:Uncharacterized protein n=1 Tax=Enhygromyxa salina TaxID=215803 RepID=A0A0C1ZVA8_9BACT|nr:hypothetical protein DB30_06189 [Enhygromyxa salina]
MLTRDQLQRAAAESGYLADALEKVDARPPPQHDQGRGWR